MPLNVLKLKIGLPVILIRNLFVDLSDLWAPALVLRWCYSKVAEPATSIKFLGMEINNEGWRLDASNHAKLMDLRIENKDSLISALGLVQYLTSAYNDVAFTKHFAELSPL